MASSRGRHITGRYIEGYRISWVLPPSRSRVQRLLANLQLSRVALVRHVGGGNDSFLQWLNPAQSRTAGMWEQLEAGPGRGRRTTPLARQKILIVDDELWAALDMEWVVQTLGHEVVGPAATADKAIELAATMRPNLVLMDVRLANNSDGVAAAIEIRERFDIPSLFVTAHGDPMTRDRAAAARPLGFIEKPFSPESLARTIEVALNPDVS
jgi:CheY-like chemotaxis protein